MTSLQALRRGRAVPGIYRVDSDLSLDACRLAFGNRVWQCYGVDGLRVVDKASLFAALSVSLPFPEWMGRNWDALEEFLRSPEILAGGHGVLVLYSSPSRLLRCDPKSSDTFISIMSDSIDFWSARDRALFLLLRDAGRSFSNIPWL